MYQYQPGSRHERGMLDLSKELIGLSTYTGETYNEQVRHWQQVHVGMTRISEFLGDNRISSKIISFPQQDGSPTRLVLVADARPKKLPAHWILVVAHLDAFAEDSIARCEPRVEDGILWGRGSADMKAAIASWLYALIIIARMGQVGVRLVITGDEESGSASLYQYLDSIPDLDQFEFVIAPEATEGGYPSVQSRGRLLFEATLPGTPVHAKWPTLGVNPIFPFARFITALEKELELPSYDNPYYAQPMSWAATMLRAGNATNGTPDGASLFIDGRFAAERQPDGTYSVGTEVPLQRFLPRLTRISYRYGIGIKVRGMVPASVIDPDYPHVRAIAQQLPGPTREVVQLGGTDLARIEIPGVEWGLPCIEWGKPGYGPHSSNEGVRVSELLRYTNTIIRYTAAVADMPPLSRDFG